MIISGVMFLANGLPANVFAYLWWNPLIHVTGMMRHAFYPTYDASYVNPGYVFLVAGVCFVLGLIGLHRFVFDALDK
jgi:capsular polysaccharide transport system permease protein